MAAELISFLETLTVTQGPRAGQPFEVLPWQREFLSGAFADGVTEAGLSVPRGNGKSTLVAGIGVAHVVGPLAQPRGEVVAVAASFDQARIVFKHALAFMESWLGPDRKLPRGKRRFKVIDNEQKALVEDTRTGAALRCIGSDPATAHGLAPVLILADEPAQWARAKADRMRSALTTSMGKLEGSRLIALGTRPAGVSHWFEELLQGGGDYALTYTTGREWGDPKGWEEANPSWSAMPVLRATIEREAAKAETNAGLRQAFRALRLNQGVEDVERSELVSAEEWQAVEIAPENAQGGPERAGAPIWGVDLGGSRSMSAVAAYWPAGGGRLEAVGAFGEIPGLADRGQADGVGDLYANMAGRGELVTLGERVTDVAALLREALERFGRPALIVADRWREAELRDALDQARFPQSAFLPRGQGWRDGGQDVRAFRLAFTDRKVRPVVSLLLRAAMAEATTVSDIVGGEKLARGSEGGRRELARDDAAAAAVLAVAGAALRPDLREAAKRRRRVAVARSA